MKRLFAHQILGLPVLIQMLLSMGDRQGAPTHKLKGFKTEQCIPFQELARNRSVVAFAVFIEDSAS
eukprot:scaffold92454_cov14-Tisochrysis_lutea.AAC.2